MTHTEDDLRVALRLLEQRVPNHSASVADAVGEDVTALHPGSTRSGRGRRTTVLAMLAVAAMIAAFATSLALWRPSQHATSQHGQVPAASPSTALTASSPSPTSDLPPLGPIPSGAQVYNRVTLTFPLNAYDMSAADSLLIGQAEDKVEKSCLRNYGLNPVWPDHTALPGPSQDLKDNGRAFGVNVEALARNYGYHAPPDPDAARKNALAQAVLANNSQTLLDVDNGTISTYDGKSVPRGGCIGQARVTVVVTATGDPMSNPAYAAESNPVVGELTYEAYQAVEQDPRLKAAWATWSNCMSQHGYDYRTPWDANNAWHGETASKQEIATAETDLACRQKQNLNGLWYALVVAYQKRAIDHNASQLTETLKQNAEDVHQAKKVLGR